MTRRHTIEAERIAEDDGGGLGILQSRHLLSQNGRPVRDRRRSGSLGRIIR